MKPSVHNNVAPKPVRPRRQLALRDAAAICVLVAMTFFVLGDRWRGLSAQWFNSGAKRNQSLPENLDYSEVEQVYDLLRINYDGELNVDQLLDGLKEGLAHATGDDYTVYLNEDDAKQFLSDVNGTFSGIGAELGLEDERLIIVSPLDGFPAQKAGLRAKDIIVKINGEDTTGFSTEEAVGKIRGEAGTDVTLTVLRANKQLEMTITREEITVPSVTSEVKDGIGYLRISRFGEDTVRLARQAAEDFNKAGVKGVILDLRNNGGGFLDKAVGVAGIWLDNQVVVEQKQGDRVIDSQRSGRNPLLAGVETVVLINEGSASASEIVAGALQDHGVAQLIGMTSFGKGSVQELEPVLSGGTLKVTVARWYTPHGNNIDDTGIEPDIKVELSEADIEAERDTQRQRAESELK